MTENTFDAKWGDIQKEAGEFKIDEKSLFVPPGVRPFTQRQINLYNYYLFIANILKKTGGKRVLEVGCGRGTISLYLATHLGADVVLLDNVSDAIEIAKEDFERNGKTAEYFVEDVLNTHFEEGSFDAVVSIGLAEHFKADEIENLFREQYRLLKPGGVMISLNIPKKFSIQSLNTVMRFFKKLAGSYKEGLRKDYYRNELKPKDFQDAAVRVGFRKTAVTRVCPFPIFVPISMKTDKAVARLNNGILWLRSLVQKYPFKTNRFVAQAHFLVGYRE